MIASHNLGFCHVDIHENYIITVINEGIIVSPRHNDALLQIAEKYFKNKTFVYISHRIYSYSVDPTIYLETTKIKNLIGFAVVSDLPQQKIQVKLEKTFLDKEFKHFDTLESALLWKDELFKNQAD